MDAALNSPSLALPSSLFSSLSQADDRMPLASRICANHRFKRYNSAIDNNRIRLYGVFLLRYLK